ncbi:uncharacterized protein LOC110813437 [Carica papaya]|uniref:uncharacterized protein LOC110813437 n=1 Tax=Carica papaya TaxID=3649 RepID=UPI000B8D16F5|nr:uncharacterized protein LOC110813437 [Carica papaya]
MFTIRSQPPFTTHFLLIFIVALLGPILGPALARRPHVITFRSTNLYPEGLAWDPSAEHFLVGSLHHRKILSVSDAGVVQTLVSDPGLPENTTILGLAVDSLNRRLLAVVQSIAPLPPFNALAAYDLRSGNRIFLSLLPSLREDDGATHEGANDVALDFKGNAYVTNSAGNFIWKVDARGDASIFSRSPLFTKNPLAVDPNASFSGCGLNGIAYVSKGYLLVVQSNTGKMFKVDAEDGTAREVLLPEKLVWADGVAVRRDGTVLVVSQQTLWFLKSQDSWGEGVVYDKKELDMEGTATSVVTGGENRVYVLYGYVLEGIKEVGREEFRIEEVRSEKDSGEEKVWVYLLIGFGFAYFLIWRFQMRQLVSNMDKKTN